MTTLRITSSNANELKFADPEAFFDTVTVKNNTQQKRAGSRTVFNSVSNINMQRLVDLPNRPNCVDNCSPLDQERLALRFYMSGSTASKAQMAKMLTDFKVVLVQVEADLAAGFLPSSDLVITFA